MTVLDANLERMLTMDDLTNQLISAGLSQYTVLSTGQLQGAHSLRLSLKLLVCKCSTCAVLVSKESLICIKEIIAF